MIKVYYNGFWSGFHNHTNAVNDIFFTELFKEVYNTDILITHNIDEADILVENTQITTSLRTIKKWKHTYLFSGESYIRSDKDEYSCVLYGNRIHKNIINIPLYIPYYISSFDESYIIENKRPNIKNVPENDILVMVSNPGGKIRNDFMQELDKYFKVTYAGNYKNNTGVALPHYYNSNEFREYVSKFKFILAMENSEEDTYITEKITHGFLAGTIPIYWGSKRITDYFNSDRFLEIKDQSDFVSIIKQMKNMTNEEWLRKVNTEPFTEFGKLYTVKTIANHIKNLLFEKPFPNLTQLYMICNEAYEPERYKILVNMCNTLGLNDYNRSFICPTFKHTITDEIMKTYVKSQRIYRLRQLPMRKSEISLFFNFKAVWEHIVKTYRDGIFLVLEADAFALPYITNFNKCLDKIKNKEWSGINISGCNGRISNFNPKESYVYDFGFRPVFTNEERQNIESNAVEDLSNPGDTDDRFMRKFHTRCTDSQLWSYKGCCQMIEAMNKDPNFDIPFDYYLCSKFETNMNIKYYWSVETYFNQASTEGLDKSTIQNDTT